jgi:hypothetical protein
MQRLFRICLVITFITLFSGIGISARAEQPDPLGSAIETKSSQEIKKQPDAEDWERLFQRVSELEAEVKRLKAGAKVRKKLEATDEERKKREEEVLSSAGRAYVLAKEGTLEVEYNGRYSHTSSPNTVGISNHTFRHTFIAEYAVRNNFTVNFNIPFVYKYDRIGSDSSRDNSDIGNISIGCQWQPIEVRSGWPTSIFFMSYSLDTGESPYDSYPNAELSTANGYDSITLGVSLSKTIDPLVVFGSLSYSYNDDITGIGGGVLEKVQTGDDIGFSLGFGFALAYNVSMNMQYQHNYRLRTKLKWEGGGSSNLATATSSMFKIGTSWRLSRKKTFHFTLGMGLTENDPDMSLTIRLPFTFLL